MKYPIGIQTFEQIINGDFVYVDKADVEKPLPMIYQSGYLAIKAYDGDTDCFMLDIPNNEVREGFLALVANINEWKEK